MARTWAPPPVLLPLALVGATVITGVLIFTSMLPVLFVSYKDAVSQLEKTQPRSFSEQGSAEVQRISRRFNAMVRRLAEGDKERAMMLSCIAHTYEHPSHGCSFVCRCRS